MKKVRIREVRWLVYIKGIFSLDLHLLKSYYSKLGYVSLQLVITS
jgi:hypothetical protein